MTVDELTELFIAAAEIDRRIPNTARPAQMKCSVHGCEDAVLRKGFCSAHHYRFSRYGEPLGGKPRYAKNGGTCRAEGCQKVATKGGWCSPHYRRHLRHGDPFAGATAKGDPEKFYREVVLKHEGDSCLIWPFGQNGEGYGRMNRDGKDCLVHRAACEETFGPPPTSRHEAAHSCGNGHVGCVSRNHVRWATPKQNHADRVEHGTSGRGQSNSMAKLSEKDVLSIRHLRARGVLQRDIAEKFGISQRAVSDIDRRRRWAWLKEEVRT